MNQISSEEVLSRIAAENPAVMLAFSRGKDSIACWLAMRPHFKQIVPVHYYLVPDLGFVNESLKYYEDWFQCKIISVPHPSLYRWIANNMFQDPAGAYANSKMRFPQVDYDWLRRCISEEQGCKDPQGWWVAVGTRANDSPARRMSFACHGPIRPKGRQFFPVWDWDKARLVAEIAKAGVRLPPEYRVFGRSFDGLDFRFLNGIQKYWPKDYEKILEWFPLAELEFKRHEFRAERGVKHG